MRYEIPLCQTGHDDIDNHEDTATTYAATAPWKHLRHMITFAHYFAASTRPLFLTHIIVSGAHENHVMNNTFSLNAFLLCIMFSVVFL